MDEATESESPYMKRMKKPGDTLNVPCDWCDTPSSYSASPNHGMYWYACADHKGKMEDVILQLKRYKHLGKAK